MNNKTRALRSRAFAILITLLASGAAVFAQTPWSQNTSPLPEPTGHVNDYAGVIDAGTVQQLETKLRDFKTKTGVEIAVAVVKTTGDRDIFDYSLAVARGWGIGATADDNPGALLFIAVDDRKYFTHISKDLEDELPDGVAGSLQRQNLVPEFRNGNYGKGISDTIDAYISTIETRLSGGPIPQAEPRETIGDRSEESFGTFCCLAIGLFILILMLSNRGRGGKSRDDDDRWGGGGGGLGGVLPWIILSGISNASSSGGSSWGGSSDWGGGGGGGWGGFGGGGDFGGGGAGGGW